MSVLSYFAKDAIGYESLDRRAKILALLMIFAIGGIFGFIYEEIFYYIDLGYLVKRGTTFGPWIPIYGFGALLIHTAAYDLRKRPFVVFLASAAGCGLLEFFTGHLLFHLKGVRLWDYNVEIWNWGNIGGYVCARSVIFFGLSGLLLVYPVMPLIMWAHETLKPKMVFFLSAIPAGLFILDIVISSIVR
ncbi:MAG: putative ABC transporter permease [Lachnospiraceae bacterium]|nr:putative ABC transporter permease [Candidatus Equihabitans merdae]